MEKIIKIESVAQFNRDRGQKLLHPLASVLDQSLSKPVQEARYISGLYIIFLKDVKCGEVKYHLQSRWLEEVAQRAISQVPSV
jgi:hypothetical protein